MAERRSRTLREAERVSSRSKKIDRINTPFFLKSVNFKISFLEACREPESVLGVRGEREEAIL